MPARRERDERRHREIGRAHEDQAERHGYVLIVMAGHSRPKDGVASLAYVPAIHDLRSRKDVDARDKPGMTADSPI